MIKFLAKLILYPLIFVIFFLSAIGYGIQEGFRYFEDRWNQ